MKSIGILGGLGPQATMDFELRLHQVSQKLIPQNANQGYPKIITYFFRQAPFISDAQGNPVEPFRVNPELLKSAKELANFCDFIVCPSNTPHFFIKEIEQTSGKKILSVVEVVKDKIIRSGVKNIGLISIGFTEKYKLYQTNFADLNLNWITINEVQAIQLDKCIFKVMEGSASEAEEKFAIDIIADLKRKGAEKIIIGCTELPLLLKSKMQNADLINPSQLLAEACIKYSIG